MALSPYRAPQSDVTAWNLELDPELDQLLRAFVAGPDRRGDKPYYLHRWRRRLAARSVLCGFNWPAFFFGSLWFLYRRMYALGLGLLAFEIARERVLDEVVPWFVGSELEAVVKSLVRVACGIGFALAANPLYLMHALRRIRLTAPGEPQMSETLVSYEGGVAWGGVWLGVLLSITVSVLFEVWLSDAS